MIDIEQIAAGNTWRLRRNVLYPNEQVLDMKMDEDDDGIHFGAFKDNKLVGVVSLFQYGTDFQFRKLAVDPSVQNMGIGSSLLQHITDYASQNGGTRIWCNARVTAIPFYLKAGFAHTANFFTKKAIDYEVLNKMLKPI
jgi:GNAT superfamily N-acetyltransferase